MKRILFYKTGKNRNGLAALVGAIEAAQGRWRSRTDPWPRPPAVLEDWEVGFFGPAAGGPPSPPGARGRPLTVLAYSFMSVDREAVAASLARLHTDGYATDHRVSTIAGGAHASGDPEGTLAMGFDHVFVGEGEATLVDGLCRLDAGLSPPRTIRASEATLPLTLDRHLSFAPVAGLLSPIELARGCPYACAFCHIPWVQGRRMRQRSVRSVLEHVEIGLARGRTRTWFVTSDAFAYGSADGGQGDPAAVRQLLRGVRAAGMPEVFFGGFPSEVRPDHVTEPLLELVATYCTNRSVVIGAQSGSDAVLRRITRGHTVSVVREAARKTATFGLVPHVDFILGLPGETTTDRRLTVDLVREITHELGGRVHVHYFMPHPGTPLAHARPEPIEPEIVQEFERLTGHSRADGYWRRQRMVAERTNAGVVEALPPLTIAPPGKGRGPGRAPPHAPVPLNPRTGEPVDGPLSAIPD